ncbi:hypothetical protein [Streptomyces tsukubensis]|uniref:hypothetical protein n=1 Tax=Streptomyces tsukubensis TaxID=83656 RepID=UPI0034501714
MALRAEAIRTVLLPRLRLRRPDSRPPHPERSRPRSASRGLRAALSAVAFAALLGAVATAGPIARAAPLGGAAAATGVRAQVPPGVSAGVAVFDRTTGTFTEQINASAQYRSASVVKLLIALDLLWNRTPDSLPVADRNRLEAMLRSSDDSAASHYWSVNGSGAVVDRMVSRLGLTDTARPPAAYPGYWGYTAVSARDTVKIYRHVLETAPVPVRDYVMGNLRQPTRCAGDGFDQHFGVAGSFLRPWAVKQGWSGFGARGDCNVSARTTEGPPPTAAAVDLARPALHSTGVVGAGDRSVVAILTLHPSGTSYGKAYTDIGKLTRSLNVPGAVRPTGTWFETWGSGVQVRSGATTVAAPQARLPEGVEVLVACQKQGQEVTVPPYVNDWWAHLPLYGGWMTNIYLKTPGNTAPGVPRC